MCSGHQNVFWRDSKNVGKEVKKNLVKDKQEKAAFEYLEKQ